MAKYKIGGAAAVVLYIMLLSAGIIVDSAPYRAQVTSGPWMVVPWAFIVAMLTYTPSNIAFLSLLAGLIAGCASRISAIPLARSQENDQQGNLEQQYMTLSMAYRMESPVASMFRSLVVYLGFMAGVLVINVEQFVTSTPEQYIRLAAAVSFFSFLVGYDPTRLSALLAGARLPVAKQAAANPEKAGEA